MLSQAQRGTIAVLLCFAFWLAWLDRGSLQAPHTENPHLTNQTANNGNTDSATNDRVADYTWWLAVLTGGLVIAAVGQGFFLLRAEKTARISASAAKDSADAAQQSARTVDEVGRAQTRAYVSIKSADLVFVGPESNPLVNIVVSNGGQTPARDFKWENPLQYYFQEQIVIEANANNDWLAKVGIDISPHSELQLESKLVLNMGFQKYVANSKPTLPHIIVRIKIAYRFTDVFGKESLGEAYFSALLQRQPPEGMKKATGLGGWGYAIFSVGRPDDWDRLKQQRDSQA
jgi:hypothetical protein